MNIQILLLLAAITADPDTASENGARFTVYTPSRTLAAAVRGQSPSYEEDGPPGAQAPQAPSSPPASVSPYQSQPYSPPPTSGGYDPFLGQPGDPAASEPGLLYGGAVGPQPYHLGWSSRFDVGYLPSSNISTGAGSFTVLEANAAWRYSTGWPTQMPAAIFSATPEFNYRGWGGPNSPDLPENVYRWASDFEIATPANNPWSIQLGFTPAIVTDTHNSLDRDSFNFDGRGVLFFRASQELTIALGATYWNRVNNYILPYAGVIWTPNERWELRLLYPKSQISYFLGPMTGAAGGAWLYGGVEYHIEAYQIGLTGTDGDAEKIELRDYRATVGIRTENNGITTFVEGGYVFARNVSFLHGTPGYTIDPGFIGRVGIRF